ncbi:hypothetical protein SAMN05216466_105388 [Paraburkholderia phenazinium]|uniref:CopL family metal-binding regulatory protein n=1 Tax=Paraburkholderia phenazinium TaxID=60549 RepID=A0A1G7XLT9_9BURK|nr:hypothetical protein SAMN05216466_105388 [Paraburkholderia phenazinium]
MGVQSRPLRYDVPINRHPVDSPSGILMNFLTRLLLLLSLALLTAHGASAHERAVDSQHMAMPSVEGAFGTAANAPAHCPGSEATASGEPCGHDHAPCCCVVTCGVHCGALFVAFQFEPHALDSAHPQSLPEPRRDGLTHAPPVRPPIG